MKIHPTAIIEDGAEMAQSVEVGPFCVVGAHVRLGEGVKLLSHVVVSGCTEIGARTIIYPHAALGGEAQMRRDNPPGMGLRLGADNIVREGVTISRGSEVGHGITTIGDRCYLMAYSHVGHDCNVGSDVTLSNGAQLGGHVSIGDGAILGGLSAVQQFGRVGRHAFIGGLSGVPTDVIPYGMAVGTHVRLRGLNLIGLRRRGIPRSTIQAMLSAYRTIFLKGTGAIRDNARHVAEKWPDIPEVQEMAAFVLAPARRPICSAGPLDGELCEA